MKDNNNPSINTVQHGIATAVAVTAAAAITYYVGTRKRHVTQSKLPSVASSKYSSPTKTKNLPRNSVTVRVPATSANMGPGFDTIGMAVDIWTEVTVERASEFSLTNQGEGADVLPTDESNLVVVGLKAAFKSAGQELPPLKIHCNNRIPFARGLGSSSAGIVAGIIAGLVLSGHELSVRGKEELLQIAAEIEGHPDNVAPAIYGGIQLGIHADGRWHTSRVQIPHGLQCVLFIPNSTGTTKEARAILPKEISRADAVFNIGRAAFLVNALVSNNPADLKYATQDMLHQPQRGDAQYPHLFPLIDAAIKAGAHGCFLSGAGPTILAITSGRSGDIFTQRSAERKECDVADAMQKAAAEHGVEGCVFITSPEHRGAHVVRADPIFSIGHVRRYEGDIKDL